MLIIKKLGLHTHLCVCSESGCAGNSGSGCSILMLVLSSFISRLWHQPSLVSASCCRFDIPSCFPKDTPVREWKAYIRGATLQTRRAPEYSTTVWWFPCWNKKTKIINSNHVTEHHCSGHFQYTISRWIMCTREPEIRTPNCMHLLNQAICWIRFVRTGKSPKCPGLHIYKTRYAHLYWGESKQVNNQITVINVTSNNINP